MTILGFDWDDACKKLSSLPRRLRTAFAAACAQRLMPAYTRSASTNLNANPQQAIKILGELWNDIQSGSFDPSKLKRDVETCATLIPDYDVGYFDGIEYAEDAILSLIHALESELKGGSRRSYMGSQKRSNHFVPFCREACGIRRKSDRNGSHRFSSVDAG